MVLTRDIITQFVAQEITVEETIEKLNEIALQTSTEERVICTHIITELYYDRNGRHLSEKYLTQLADYVMADEIKVVNKPKHEYSLLSDRKQRTIQDEREDNFGSSNRIFQTLTDERYSIRI